MAATIPLKCPQPSAFVNPMPRGRKMLLNGCRGRLSVEVKGGGGKRAIFHALSSVAQRRNGSVQFSRALSAKSNTMSSWHPSELAFDICLQVR